MLGRTGITHTDVTQQAVKQGWKSNEIILVCIFCMVRKPCSPPMWCVSSLSHLDSSRGSEIYQHMHSCIASGQIMHGCCSRWYAVWMDVCLCRLVVFREQMLGCWALVMHWPVRAPCRLSVQTLFKYPKSFSTPYWPSLFSSRLLKGYLQPFPLLSQTKRFADAPSFGKHAIKTHFFHYEKLQVDEFCIRLQHLTRQGFTVKCSSP